MNAFATDYYFTNIQKDFGIQFLGQAILAVKSHIDYYEKLRPVHLNKLREVVDRHSKLISSEPINLDAYQVSFSQDVKNSLESSIEARKMRLKVAKKEPTKVTAISEIFLRNPDVVAEVLHRAHGTCERCQKSAPFLRKKDKSPYLEVHHMIQLGDGGKDTTDNAVALCPNCHRELHFGV